MTDNILKKHVERTAKELVAQIPIRGHAVDFVAVLPPKWK